MDIRNILQDLGYLDEKSIVATVFCFTTSIFSEISKSDTTFFFNIILIFSTIYYNVVRTKNEHKNNKK